LERRLKIQRQKASKPSIPAKKSKEHLAYIGEICRTKPWIEEKYL